MKKIRKLLTFVLAVILLLSSASPVLADTLATSQSIPYSETRMAEYAHSMITSYLRINNLFHEGNAYFLSQGVPIENDDDPYNCVFWAFEDNSNIGYLVATFLNGSYYSSFIPSSLSEIESAYSDSRPISLTSHDTVCYLYYGDTYTQISGIARDTTVVASSWNCSPTSQTQLVLNPIDIPAVTPYGSSLQILLEVPIIRNQNSPDTGDGLCWAACIGSIGAYIADLHAQTAQTIYMWASQNITVSGYEFPVGIPAFELPLLSKRYGVTYQRYNYLPSIDGVYSILQQDRPIHMSIKRTGSAHAIVLCGVSISGSEAYFIVMDPNIPDNYVTIPVTDPASSFVYVTSYGYTYTALQYRLN